MEKSVFIKVYLLFTGILMGIADTLPGVSGSTITYVLGVYEDFIQAISEITKRDNFKKSLLLLLNIALGWASGVIISILLLSKFANTHIYFISSLFLGLIIFTSYKTYKELQQDNGFKGNNIIYLILGLIITIIIFFFGWGLASIFRGPLLYVYIFIVSFSAMTCMLLPGISGSTILLIFGMYYPLIKTLNSILLKQDFTNILYLLIFCLGALCGLIISAKIINKVFKKYKTYGQNIILGILIGSIVPIIYGPLTIEGKNYSILNFSNISYVALLLGIIILILLERISKIKDKKIKEATYE